MKSRHRFTIQPKIVTKEHVQEQQQIRSTPQQLWWRWLKPACRMILLFLAFAPRPVFAQLYESRVLNGEYGVSAGAAHYFGDLNTQYGISRPKIAASVLFRRQFGHYIALRLQGSFARLGYSDQYSSNESQRLRNLSFNTDIFEMALLGDFNFFRFIPGEKSYGFTPFVSIGAGMFNFDPYAWLNNKKYLLRPIGTEGQGSNQYPDRKIYNTMAFCFPLGVGFKYNLTERTNLTFEIQHRFTATDYLDDVSSTYAGADVFLPLPNGDPSPGLLLQDRSYALTATPIGIAGRQRGNSRQKDQFITAQIGITFNLNSYRCPTSD